MSSMTRGSLAGLARALILIPMLPAAFAFAKPTMAAESSPPPLGSVQIPKVTGLNHFVANKPQAIVLGKALFWDMQLGSDGGACASCHFHAGADSRVKNQLSPGLRREGNPDTTFQTTASGGRGGPNYTLVKEDFPFHQFNDPDDRNSGPKFQTNDVASSQGTFGGDFVDVGEEEFENCNLELDSIFHVNNINTRKVEPRQTPTVINAVFNFRNFWDGRANNRFNGVDPFGSRNENAMVIGTGGVPERVELDNLSLASQGSGPPLSDFELSCAQRRFAEVGKKLLQRRALATQRVHRFDSLLKNERAANGIGLTKTYRQLIEKAFDREYWETSGSFNGYTQMQANFSLFFGVALHLYQSTLVSDRAPYDEFAAEHLEPFDPVKGRQDRLTLAERRGLDIFLDKGKCINCHKGAEFTGAASVLQNENEEGGLVERMTMNDGGVALYDSGFYNIGVTPTEEDIGVGGTDPFGNPLSFAAQFAQGRFVDPIKVDPCTFEVPFEKDNCGSVPLDLTGERLAVNGAFKVPTLRNIELTGPYMHDGSMATLQQVVEFYNRGGNVDNPERDPDIGRLGLSSEEKADLVAFLGTLTDPRVAREERPFDHPQLFIPNGHSTDETVVDDGDGNRLGDNHLVELPAVGHKGRLDIGLLPLQTFLNVDFENTAPPVDICARGRPQQLTFLYTGQSCAVTTNFQNGKVSCAGDPDDAIGVQVVALKGGQVSSQPANSLDIGDQVTISNGGKKLHPNVGLEIRQNGNTLQSLGIHTACANPLYLNDRFGSLMLVDSAPR